MVEAAIILPVFLTLILGMLDLSIGVFRHHVVSQAAARACAAPSSTGRWPPPR